MKYDWTQFSSEDFSEQKFKELLQTPEEHMDDEFWQKFFWYFQMGTTSNAITRQNHKIYEIAYQFLRQPVHIRCFYQLQDIELRLKIVRRFPFLAFCNQQKRGRRIWQQLRNH